MESWSGETFTAAAASMEILTHAQIKRWRKAHMPKRCPIMERKISNPHLDHDHREGVLRNVIEGVANVLAGKIENCWYSLCRSKTNLYLPDVLRNLADYFEADYSEHPLHPNHRRKLRRDFLKLRKNKQIEVLDEIGVDMEGLNNAKDRAEAYLHEMLEPYEFV